MFPAASDNSETLGLLSRVFDEAWMDVQSMVGKNLLDPTSMRSALAKRIMAAADDGERDPARLKLNALQAIDA